MILAALMVTTGAVAQQPAGQTRAGEACTYVQATAEPTLRARQAVDIRCGGANDPVGRVYQVDGASDSGALSAWTASGSWRALLDSRAYCERPSATTLAGQPAALLACARRSGGVPYVAVATSRGGSTYLGEGLSTATPAIEATIAALSGGAVGGRTGTLGAALGGRYAATYKAADADRYKALM